MSEDVLLTGATGYVGGRLLRALEDQKTPVRCLCRRPVELKQRTKPETGVVAGDVLYPESLETAFEGIHTAYYLIHSMGQNKDFAERDHQAATHFGQACKKANVQKIIYLGGLSAADHAPTSAHLRSRQEVGDLLRASGVPVIEFRASIILGSGSLSFELIRALVERLPVMVTPRWVSTPAQPIGIEDVIAYLLAALKCPAGETHIYEIGGKDQMSYGQLMHEYARQRGLHRWMIPVSVLTPRLSSLWLGLVTPVYARVGRQLLESMRSPSIVQNPEALKTFSVVPMDTHQAIARALRHEDQDFAETWWFDALSSSGDESDWGGVRFGNRLIDSRSLSFHGSREMLFDIVRQVGGAQGWYFGNRLWRLRGWMDLWVGGAGLRRGRRHPRNLRVGDPLDFWRVEAFEPPRLLRLKAEMKIPGRAWLEFEIEEGRSQSTIRQTALFDPLGLWGLLYWYMLYPVHQFIFAGMLRRIVYAATQAQRLTEREPSSAPHPSK